MTSSFLRWNATGVGRSLRGVVGVKTRDVRHCSTIKNEASGASVPPEADVVVIGGGMVGCSALYHLAKLGVTNTVLLEAHQLTAGTTWHTAGLMYRLAWSEMEMALKDATYRLLKGMHDEVGVDPGWTGNGSIFLGSKMQGRERRKDFQRVMTLGRVFGLESFLLEAHQVKELYPLMDVTGLECALYNPHDGSMDPAGMCLGMSRFATRAGARVVENCPVTDLRTKRAALGGSEVSEVHTPFGVIRTGAVINATGAWANDICSMIGVELPIQSFRHGYVVTERIQGIENMPNARDYDASCYMKLQGDGLTIGGFELNPVPIDKLSPDFPFGLYEPDMDIVSELLQKAALRIPVLESTGIKSTVYGPESFTPDNMPIVGEEPSVLGFFHCCAFNSHGMQLGGGCGDQIAKWAAKGRPELDLFGLDSRRFHPPLVGNRAWVLARSHEGLTRNYSLKFPNDEPLAGRRLRLSPLHQVLEDAGCVFQEKQGWERPGWFGEEAAPVQEYDWYGSYGTPLAADQRYNDALRGECTFGFPAHHHLIRNECLACREAAALFDQTSFGKLYLTGADAQRAADWVFSADVDRAPGATVYTCMLNSGGGTEADLTVSICEGGEGSPCDPTFDGRGFYLTTGGSTGNYVKTHILMEARARGWDVQVLDHTDDLSLLSLQGPRSRAVLQQVTDEDLTDGAFPFSTHKVITVAGHKARALRLTFVGEMGWELHLPRASALAVYEALMAAGKPFGMANAGFRALDSLSCEKGYRHWHSDLRTDDTPLEAGLSFACKLDGETEFLGREALEGQRAKGVHKRLVALTLEEEPSRPLWGLEAIRRDGEIVGYVRRADYAFALRRSVAFGYVRRPDGGVVTKDFLRTGKWQIESMTTPLEAALHVRSPFDPKNLRVKGIYDNNDPLLHTASG